MPNRDGTGPFGGGPMTGFGMGPCSKGQMRTAVRRFGRMGRGWRCGYAYDVPDSSPLSKEEEKSVLESEIKLLENELKSIRERIAELDE